MQVPTPAGALSGRLVLPDRYTMLVNGRIRCFHGAHLPAFFLLCQSDIIYAREVIERHHRLSYAHLSVLREDFVAAFAVVLNAFVGFKKFDIFLLAYTAVVVRIAVLKIIRK